jgi:hypothetical protein
MAERENETNKQTNKTEGGKRKEIKHLRKGKGKPHKERERNRS